MTVEAPQRSGAACTSSNAIAVVRVRHPGALATPWRSLTVENVDSISRREHGLVDGGEDDGASDA